MERKIWGGNASAQKDTLSPRQTTDGLGKTKANPVPIPADNKNLCSIMGKPARIQEQKGKYSQDFGNH